MPTPDPWLSARMAQYTAIRRAEAELHPAIAQAVAAFLEEASTGVLGALTAAADEPPNSAGIPGQAAWRRILDRFVLGPTRALWRGSFGRVTGRDQADVPEDDGGHGAGLGERLAGFRTAFANRLMRTLLTSRERAETPDELRARLAELMTLEGWDGQIMTMTRTETMTALNAGAAHGALAEQERTGEPWVKRWQATHDQRVRHTHSEADGQLRPLADPFEVGGHRLQFPGDPKGPAGEVINCRCSAMYGPADAPLAASARQEGTPMTTPTVTETGPVTVEPSGRWRGVLGFMDEWSADQRMLAAPGGQVASRPLPLPLLVQSTLASGHDGSKLGVGVIDRIWTEGNAVFGEGRFDLEDPLGASLARKVGLGFIRFVSLDVDNATAHQVLVNEAGEIVTDGDPKDRTLAVGDVYSEWRVMGATLLAHPAFPNAAIALADSDGQALTAAAFAEIVGYNPEWGCVKQDGEAWVAADCEDPDAVPANPTGDGPFQPEGEPTAEAAAKPRPEDGQEDAQQPAEDTDVDPADTVPTDVEADPQEAAEELEPGAEAADEDPDKKAEAAADPIPADEGEAVPVDPAAEDAPCVIPTEDGTGWVAAPCDAPGAVPANPTGDGPADQGTGLEMATTDGETAIPADGETGDAPEPATGAPTHAGLAVTALDTGRVLLLQRALDEEDPASGCWEFPGGSIEDGEDPQDAAFREFAEETGLDVSGQVSVVDTWTAPNGIYQGFVGTVPAETDLGINPDDDGRATVNPDDPDGTKPEVVAWWELDHLPELTSLREEVRDTPWDKIRDAATATATDPAARPAGRAEAVAAALQDGTTSPVPDDCEPCKGVAVTAASTGTFAPGWTPPADWFTQAPQGGGPYSIRIDTETGRVHGYLAAWGSCHVGYKDRCITPPRSATDYGFFNIRPVKTSGGTAYCGLLTMNTGHASLAAGAAAAMAHYDNTGTQAAVVRVGEDNHGIWVAGAVLPFVSAEDRLRLSLSSFSGDWRRVRGGAELIAALAVNSPGFPLSAKKTDEDNALFALTAAAFWPEEEEGTAPEPGTRELTSAVGEFQVGGIDTQGMATAVADELEERAARRQRAAAVTDKMTAFRTQTEQRRAADASRRVRLARQRVTRAQPQKKTETPIELMGTGALPNPSTHDIALAKNWITEQGGLPSYIKRISDHLEAKGMDTSRAIATAVNAAKKMCASGDLNWPGIQKVNPGSKAEACAAIAKWEEMKAAARAS